jgi:hypothetical protein
MDKGNTPVGRVSRAGDLRSSALPALESFDDNSVQVLYRWTEGAAIETIEWYLSEKRAKARWSRVLRVMAVLLIVGGGVTPVIAVASRSAGLAIWGYIPLGLGAGCVGLDRAFGFSSSWMRYLATATAIQRSLMAFQLAWAELIANKNLGGYKSLEWTLAALRLIMKFADSLSGFVESETQSWVSEFHSHVSDLERQASKL